MYIHHFAHRTAAANAADSTHVFQPWGDYWCGRLAEGALLTENDFDRQNGRQYKRLDRSAQLSVTLVNELVEKGVRPDWLIVGSARGATGVLEQTHSSFALQASIPVQTSPTTTPGNLASFATQLNKLSCNSLTVSMTCSSALHAVIAGIEKLHFGSGELVIAGGVEAPVTPFTRKQFEVLRLLARHSSNGGHPCQPFSGDDTNRVVLAEGGAFFALSKQASNYRISGWGEAAQELQTPVSIAADALRTAMSTALSRANCSKDNPVDLVIAHAPGTALGDPEELGAIREICGNHPRIIGGKYATGHTLGASGAVAMAQAIDMMENGIPDLPYLSLDDHGFAGTPRRVLVNATGFGGNAASILIEKV